MKNKLKNVMKQREQVNIVVNKLYSFLTYKSHFQFSMTAYHII